jgi:hypothetical protein
MVDDLSADVAEGLAGFDTNIADDRLPTAVGSRIGGTDLQGRAR